MRGKVCGDRCFGYPVVWLNCLWGGPESRYPGTVSVGCRPASAGCFVRWSESGQCPVLECLQVLPVGAGQEPTGRASSVQAAVSPMFGWV